MKNKYLGFFISSLLMFMSGIFLLSALIYYDLSDYVEDYNYSDYDEYVNVREGLDFLSKLPIQFNIINKFFSDFNHLDQNEKEQIVMAYAIKNRYELYECGPNNNSKLHLCIDTNTLNSSDLLFRFGLDFEFENEEIKLYLDDYGASSVSNDLGESFYRITLNNDNNKAYRLYSVFDSFKQDNDLYIFYLYQGYYSGNCTKGDDITLFDFITGNALYTGKCNGNNEFVVIPDDVIKKLQLYKYELKKDDNDRFYLYGYNPVRYH